MSARRLLGLVAAALAAHGMGAQAAVADPTGTPEVIAAGLTTPWEVVVVPSVAGAPDGRVWVTERDCRVIAIGPGGTSTEIFQDTTPDSTCHKFLGLEVDPAFVTNRFVYLYETLQAAGESPRSRVLRLTDTGSGLTGPQVIFDRIDSDLSHDGGRIKFGPDGMLYVTTGDIHDPGRPQDIDNLNGKILRMTSTGQAPGDNPFFDPGQPGGNRSFVWSYGHRHPQGISWDENGRMWESEHGPSGEAHAPAEAKCCNDELNLIQRGQNYGWPLVAGDATLAGTQPPAAHSGSEHTWAPGGLAYAEDGRLYAPMLRDRHLRQFGLGCPSPWSTTGLGAQLGHYEAPGGFGRLRTATAAPGALYFTTDNGSESQLLRVTLGPKGYTPCAPQPDPPVSYPPVINPQTQSPAPGPAVTSTAPGDAAQTGPGSSIQAPGAGRPTVGVERAAPARGSAAAALRRLLSRARSAIRRDPRLASGTLTASAGGFGPGTLSLTLRGGTKGAAPALAWGSRTVIGRRTVSVRAKVTSAGLRVLRSATPRRRYRLTARFRQAGGTRTTRTVALLLPAAR